MTAPSVYHSFLLFFSLSYSVINTCWVEHRHIEKYAKGNSTDTIRSDICSAVECEERFASSITADKLKSLGDPLLNMSYRAGKSGLAADIQRKVDANYSTDEGVKCLNWIRSIVIDCEEIPERSEDIDASPNNFYEILRNGILLCKLIDRLFPGRINWSDKTFQTPKIEAMRSMRERERISMFTTLVQEFGVQETFTFPTESLHEKGVLNLAQVCACIRALGIEAQGKPGYSGPENYWPRKSERNVRKFSEQQLRASQAIISLQYGTNIGANQAGMSFGKTRKIID